MPSDAAKILRPFSDAELLEELARREEARSRRKPVKHWCDDCDHFKPWSKPLIEDIPDDYNPCGKGHKMSFRVPESYTSIDYGFYRRVCKDRAETTGNTDL